MDHTHNLHNIHRETEKEKYFRLHVDEKPDQHHHITEEKQHKHHPEHKKHKRTVKEVFDDIFRQIIASAVFLVVGFLLLNWSSYSQIFKLKWDRLWNINQESPLTDLIEDPKDIVFEKEILRITTDPAVQKRQIPELNMEVTPVDNRLIIPRINQNIPIVRVSSESLIKKDWAALEAEMQQALRDGVVHYPGTSLPGQRGNTVITGHSSYFPWDPGRFKDVFALLHDVVIGDKIVVYHKQDKYTYEVTDIKIVLPEDIDVLKQSPQDKLTLITCTPVGTNLKRLVVIAKPIAKNNKPLEKPQTKVQR